MNEKEINLQVEGINLKGWLCQPEVQDLNKPLMVLCHGVPGRKQYDTRGKDDDGGYYALAKLCVEEGFLTFYFNFRGAGESEGDFDLKGWTRDLKAFLDYLDENNYTGNKSFYLWGFSAGAAVSTYIASGDERVKGVVLAACPENFEERFPRKDLEEIIKNFRERGIIRDPEFPRDREKWLEDIYAVSPKNYIEKITPTPLLIIHGTHDELIPYSDAYNLFVRAGEPKDIFIFSRGQHQLRKNSRAVGKCLEWFKRDCEHGTF